MSEVDKDSDEFKQAVSDAVAEQTEGLKSKVNELLGKLKKAQQGQQIDPADLQAVENERDELKAKLSDANKALSKAQKAEAEATKRATDVDAAYSKSVADAALTEALTKAGVTNPAYLQAAKALLGSAVTVAEEEGKRVVKAGDKALADFTKEWASSEDGKNFVSAPDASGGGSQGGRGTTTTQTKGDFGGTREERAAAIAQKFPNLPK